MRVFKAPERKSPEEQLPLKVFLAGSIEMGVAENWQDRLTGEFENYNVEVYNPRRDDWDSSWVQDPTRGTQFHEQVSWELDHIVEADLVVFFFDKDTKSPITLAELGLSIGLGKEIMVYCPQEFFRYGNVAVMMNKFNYMDKLFINEDEFVAELKLLLEKYTILGLDLDESKSVGEKVIDEVPVAHSVNILQESVNSNFNEYIREKYLK